MATSTSQLRTWLDEAMTARHQLATGLLQSYTTNGQTFTRMRVADLDQYIASLRRDIRRASGRGRFSHVRREAAT